VREIALALALLTGCVKNDPKPDPRARCIEVLDKYGALLAREGHDAEASAEEIARARSSLKTTEGMSRCEADLTETRYRCAIAATSADAVERCFEPRD
jgi:hypothetical protein